MLSKLTDLDSVYQIGKVAIVILSQLVQVFGISCQSLLEVDWLQFRLLGTNVKDHPSQSLVRSLSPPCEHTWDKVFYVVELLTFHFVGKEGVTVMQRVSWRWGLGWLLAEQIMKIAEMQVFGHCCPWWWLRRWCRDGGIVGPHHIFKDQLLSLWGGEGFNGIWV